MKTPSDFARRILMLLMGRSIPAADEPAMVWLESVASDALSNATLSPRLAAWLEEGEAIAASAAHHISPAALAQLRTAVSQARFYAGGLVK